MGRLMLDIRDKRSRIKICVSTDVSLPLYVYRRTPTGGVFIAELESYEKLK
jgi:hypothetical protein